MIDPEFRGRVLVLLRECDEKAADRYEYCHASGWGRASYCPTYHDAKNAALASKPVDLDAVLKHTHKFYPSSCGLRICAICAEQQAARLMATYVPRVARAVKVRHPGWSLKHVTLTRTVALHDENIGEEIKTALDAAHEVFKVISQGHPDAGGLAVLEIGPKGHLLHVHMIYYGPFVWHSEHTERKYLKRKGLPESDLSGGPYLDVLWHSLTGDYVVDIRKATPARVRYLVGYPLKFDKETAAETLTPEFLIALHLALKGRRRVRSWGAFFAPVAEEEDEEERGVCEECGAKLVQTTEHEFMTKIAKPLNLISVNKYEAVQPPIPPPPPPEPSPAEIQASFYDDASFHGLMD